MIGARFGLVRPTARSVPPAACAAWRVRGLGVMQAACCITPSLCTCCCCSQFCVLRPLEPRLTCPPVPTSHLSLQNGPAMTRKEIAAHVGCSHRTVAKLEQSAMETMRKPSRAALLLPFQQDVDAEEEDEALGTVTTRGRM